MSDPISPSASEPPSVVPNHAFTAAREPLAARIVGGITGAITFALCALWFGPTAGIAIALVAAVAALSRRSLLTSTAFFAAAGLSAAALLPLTIAVFFAAIAFGEGLVRIARAPRADD
jgi:hypothetical protein